MYFNSLIKTSIDQNLFDELQFIVRGTGTTQDISLPEYVVPVFNLLLMETDSRTQEENASPKLKKDEIRVRKGY